MPIIDDMLRGLQIQIDTLWYNILLLAGGDPLEPGTRLYHDGLHHRTDESRGWSINAFTPLIAQTNASLQVAVSLAFAIALLVLGITYLLAAFARMRVVEPRSAIAWYLAGALFFALGPSLIRA